MHVTDWLPTFLSMAGVSTLDIFGSMDGIDQWISLRDNNPSPRNEMLYNILPKNEQKLKSAGIR